MIIPHIILLLFLLSGAGLFAAVTYSLWDPKSMLKSLLAGGMTLLCFVGSVIQATGLLT